MRKSSIHHLNPLSRRASVVQAQSNFQIKISGITAIIDLILLAQIQAPFKTFCPPGGCTFGGGTGGTGTGTGTGLN